MDDPAKIKSVLKKKSVIGRRISLFAPWKNMKRVYPDYKIIDGMTIKILLFRSSDDAITWALLSEYGIPISDYINLHAIQFDKKPSEIKFHYPLLIDATYQRKGQTDMDDFVFKDITERYILNGYEQGCGWCPLCRGLNLMQILKFDMPPDRKGIPTPTYRISCMHEKMFNKIK